MQTPVEIVFDDIESSSAFEQRIRERARRLGRVYDGITSCHVALSIPQRDPCAGRSWCVRVEVRVPGAELATAPDPGDVAAHDDLLVAIRDAFDVMERELECWHAKLRGELEAHATSAREPAATSTARDAAAEAP
jgi:ribosome-associated translation inhibitor RaiA